jgi:hypothetical protein
MYVTLNTLIKHNKGIGMSDNQIDINKEQGFEKLSLSDPRLYITPSTDKGFAVMTAMRSLTDKFTIAKKKINSLPFVEKEFIEQGENPLMGTVRLEDLQDVIFEVFGLSLIINTEGFDLGKSINGVAATVYVLTESDGYQPIATMQRTLAQLSSSYTRAVDPYLLLASESQAIVRAAAQVGLCRTEMTIEGQQAAVEDVKAHAEYIEKAKAKAEAEAKPTVEKKVVKAKPTVEKKVVKAKPTVEKKVVKAKPTVEKKVVKAKPTKAADLPSNEDKVSSSKLSVSDKNDGYPDVAEMRDLVTHFLTEEGMTQKAFIRQSLGEDVKERRVNKLEISDLKELFNQLPEKDKK